MLFTTSLQKVVTFVALSVGFFIFTSTPALAQDAPTDAGPHLCAVAPITPSVRITEALEIENTLNNKVIIVNSSDYHLGGLQVVVGVFTAGELSYVAVTNDNLTLTPQEEVTQTIVLDTQALPAGSYQYAAVVTQGNVVDAVSNLLLVDESRKYTFIKTSSAQPLVQTDILINDEEVGEQTVAIAAATQLTAAARTQNVSEEPLLDMQQVVALTRGTNPFGTAISKQVFDTAKLFPDATRTTEFSDESVTDGTYTLYAFSLIPGTFTPVATQSVQLGEAQSTEFATRIARVGLADTPSTETEYELATCIEELVDGSVESIFANQVILGVAQDSTSVFDPQAIEVVDGEAVILIPTVKPDMETTVSLYEDLDPSNEAATNLSEKQTISYTFDCEQHLVCVETIVEQVTEFTQTKPAQSAYWTYIGIGVGLLIVMFILMRNRQLPEPVTKDDETDS